MCGGVLQSARGLKCVLSRGVTPLAAGPARFLRRIWRRCYTLRGKRLDKMKSPDDEIADPESPSGVIQMSLCLRHISRNNLLGGEQFSAWLASYRLVVSSFCLLEELLLPSHILDPARLMSFHPKQSDYIFYHSIIFQTMLPRSVSAAAGAWKHGERGCNLFSQTC